MTLTGRSGTVRKTASARKASVPSDPTRRARRLDRALVIEERVERVPGRVLRPVLRADARRERARPTTCARSSGSPARAPAPSPAEGRPRRGGRVDRGARRKQEREGVERVVGVLRDAAAHPPRVVREDPADHARVDRGRVGPDLPAERARRAVHVPADHPGLDADPRADRPRPRGRASRAPFDEDAVLTDWPESHVPAARKMSGTPCARETAKGARTSSASTRGRRRAGRGGRSSRPTPTRRGRSRAS